MRPKRIEVKTSITAQTVRARNSRVVNAEIANTNQQSLQPVLTPPELTLMSAKDLEMYRRLQASAKHILEHSANLSMLHDQWLDKLQPLRPVQLSAAHKNPLNWSVIEVADFVSQLPHCSFLGDVFIEHEIDGVAFLSLRQNDMVKLMGLSLGSAIKVFNRIVFLREECNANYIQYI